MADIAARARIEEMSSPWALGDYDRFARELVWGLGPELVEACTVGPGQRVLDVAAGTGNVALRAAQAGAQVVASDLTGESLAIGERNARDLDLQSQSVQADAQALPFADGEFDVVTSAVGAIFAPDHQAVADEPPPPPGALPPVLWSSEEHVRELFGNRVASLDMTRRRLTRAFASAPARTPADDVAAGAANPAPRAGCAGIPGSALRHRARPRHEDLHPSKTNRSRFGSAAA